MRQAPFEVREQGTGTNRPRGPTRGMCTIGGVALAIAALSVRAVGVDDFNKAPAPAYRFASSTTQRLALQSVRAVTEPETNVMVSAEMAAAVEGCWELGEGYRVTLRRTASGLRADQEANTRLGKRELRDEPVRYDAESRTVGFTGLGAIHRTLVVLRPLASSGMEFAFSSETDVGHWTQGDWKDARRCSSGPK